MYSKMFIVNNEHGQIILHAEGKKCPMGAKPSPKPSLRPVIFFPSRGG